MITYYILYLKLQLTGYNMLSHQNDRAHSQIQCTDFNEIIKINYFIPLPY